ncbi:MAG: hypothetical protein U1E08_07880 [Coriobacteriia bacterium]|nr:hypothetical protein [Coriobacteriia bacterium]
MTLLEFFGQFFARRPPASEPGRGLAAAEVMSQHAERLMRMKGVMSVGVGTTDDGEPAIVVGLDDPRAASVADIPESIDGVPVVHHRIGRSDVQD